VFYFLCKLLHVELLGTQRSLKTMNNCITWPMLSHSSDLLSNSAVYFLLSQPWEILWGILFHIMRYKKHPLSGKALIQKQEWLDNDKLSEAASNWCWWTGSLIHTSLPWKMDKISMWLQREPSRKQVSWVSRSSRKIM
jgi:hypothetical protein